MPSIGAIRRRRFTSCSFCSTVALRAFDRLVLRAVDKTSTFDYADAALEYYGYDGQDLLFDISDPDGPNIGQSPAIKHRYLQGPAVDQILSQENVGGETLWMLTDHQGSVRDLVRNDGTIAAHYQYDSFGKPLDGLESVTRFGYAGYERDTATGYYKTDARWYDPQSGKWLSEDPIGFAGGDANLSRYVENGATNWVDPGGNIKLNPWSVETWISWMGGDATTPPPPVDDHTEKFGDPRDINVLLDELEHRGKTFSSIDGLELNHKRAKNEIIANSIKAGVCDAAANTMEAAILVASIPLPGPEDAIVWAWAAKRGITIAGKPGSYALFKHGKKLTGEAAESAAEAIAEFARSDALGKVAGRGGKQAKLRSLVSDPAVSSADRGWIQQELNAIERGQRSRIRVPPGKNLAHRRGCEAKNGLDTSTAIFKTSNFTNFNTSTRVISNDLEPTAEGGYFHDGSQWRRAV